MKWQGKNSVVVSIWPKRKAKVEKIYKGIVNGQEVDIVRFETIEPKPLSGIPAFPAERKAWEEVVFTVEKL